MAQINSNGTGGGLASDTTSWDGGVVPVEGDSVYVASGDVIEVDGVYIWGDDSSTAVKVKGTLKASRTASSSLTCKGHLYIDSYGVLDYGTQIDPIPMQTTATILLNYSASMATTKWGITGYWREAVKFFGAETNIHTFITSAVSVNDTTVSLNDITNWKVGDEFIVGTTANGYAKQEEKMVVSSISGNTITTTTAFQFAHEVNGKVSILTHNVSIKAYDNNYVASNKIYSGGVNEIGYTQIVGLNFGLYLYNAIWENVIGVSVEIINQYDVGVYFYTNTQDILAKDIVLYGKNVGIGLETRQNSTGKIENMINYGIYTSIQSSNGGGGIGCVISNSVFLSASRLFFMDIGQDFIFNDCIFASSDLFYDLGFGSPCKFNRCYIGTSITNGGFSGAINTFTKYQTNINTILTFFDCFYNLINPITQNTMTKNNSIFEIFLNNKNKDIEVQESYKYTGLGEKSSISKNGDYSFKVTPFNDSAILGKPYIREINLIAGANETIKILGNIQCTSDFYNSGDWTPPTVSLKGYGLATEIFTATSNCNGAWESFELNIINTTSNTTEMVIELATTLKTLSNGSVYFDGLIDIPFVNKTRFYGFVFNKGSNKRYINNFIVKSEIDASNIANINIDNTNKFIDITANISKNDMYDYTQYWSVTNLDKDVPIDTQDGKTYTLGSGWSLELNGNITDKIGINGDVIVPNILDLYDYDITTLSLGEAGTYNFTNVIVDTLVNTSTGNLIINALGNTSITNIGSNITVNNSKSFSFVVSPSITGYEWRIYEVDGFGSLNGAINLAGEESATQDNQTYTYNYTTEKVIALQILGHENDYVENITYYTLGDIDQSVVINLVKDNNN